MAVYKNKNTFASHLLVLIVLGRACTNGLRVGPARPIGMTQLGSGWSAGRAGPPKASYFFNIFFCAIDAAVSALMYTIDTPKKCCWLKEKRKKMTEK